MNGKIQVANTKFMEELRMVRSELGSGMAKCMEQSRMVRIKEGPRKVRQILVWQHFWKG